jgi:hypothetical protein
MNRLFLVMFLAVVFLGVGLVLSCGDDDHDNDDNDVDNDTDDDTDDDDDSATGDTWTDSSSGLIWQVTPSSDGMTWDDAIAYCENLSLAGGGWHLPTISELRTLIRGCDGTMISGACGVTDSCTDRYDCKNDVCDGCEDLEGPGDGGAYWPDGISGEIDFYWSSTTVADSEYDAWHVDFDRGLVTSKDGVTGDDLARCVR